MATEKNKKKKILFFSIGALFTGIAGYLGWRAYNKAKDNPAYVQDTFIEPKTTSSDAVSTSYTAAKSTVKTAKKLVESIVDFPIAKGSKGEKVKLLQQALIDKYGKSILPKSGADGAYGSEMATALKKVGLPAEIDESTYNVLIQGRSIDPAKIAEDLFRGATSKDFNKVINTLKQMKTVNDYQMVNDIFKTRYYFGLVRKTLVTGLLDSFASDEQKKQIRLQFARIGLKYDGQSWSLSGAPLSEKLLITKENCTVYDQNRKPIQLLANTILGRFIEEKQGFSLFENNGQKFLVSSPSVNFY